MSSPESPHPYFDERAGERETHIKNLFESLDNKGADYLDADAILEGSSKLTHLPAHTRYATDHLQICDTTRNDVVDYQELKTYVLEKEKELWQSFSKIDQSGDCRLLPSDIGIALKKAGIHVTENDIKDYACYRY